MTAAMTIPKKEKVWVPIRRGPIYCSPACGCGCQRDAFEKATRAARNLAEQLGGGWLPRVWENMGWHWAVVLGPEGGAYRLRGGVGGWSLMHGPHLVHGDTPRGAIFAMVDLLRDESKRLSAEARLLIEGA